MIRSKYNDVGRNVGQQQSGLPSNLNTKGNSGVIKTKQENKKAGTLDSHIDPELHRLITEWREKKTRDDYQPYSEEELREFGELWKVGVLSRQPEYLRTKEEIHEGLKELEELYMTLIRVADNFYELAWIRRSPDFWDHIWLTFHLAGATVEEVWEIVHHKWPKLLEEGKFFGLHEIEKLREFIGSSNTILLQCDYLLGEFEFKRERACCLKLYKVLRSFPIAPGWKLRTSWETRDKMVLHQGAGILNRRTRWFRSWYTRGENQTSL